MAKGEAKVAALFDTKAYKQMLAVYEQILRDQQDDEEEVEMLLLAL